MRYVQGLPVSRKRLHATFTPKSGPAVNAQPSTHFFHHQKKFYTALPWPKEKKKLVQRTEEMLKEEFSSIRLMNELTKFKKPKKLL